MAVIGDIDVILAFKALGADIFPVTKSSKIKDIIKTLTEKGYSIILITEKEAVKIDEFLNKQKTKTYPIILPIPDGSANLNYGKNKIEESIEKAIGKNAGLIKEKR